VVVSGSETECDTFTLQRSDIIIYQLDRPALDLALTRVFGLFEGAEFDTDLFGTTAHRLLLPVCRYRFPAYLTIQIEPTDFTATADGLLARNDTPFILLAPTRTRCTGNTEKRLTDRRSIFVPLSENVAIGENQQLQMLRPLNDILAQFRSFNLPSLERDGARNSKPTLQWELLSDFAEERGRIDWNSSKADPKNQKRRELLSENLRDFFRIKGDPLMITADGKGWQTHFQISQDE
jgi:hypothetical protein